MNALTVIPPGGGSSNLDHYRASTDAAAICKEIVLATSKKIGDRNYVAVEGWQAIAIAHGCAASSRDVERVEGGYKAVGEIRRMSDGHVIAEAEGFVGEDEPVWFGGEAEGWEWGQKRGERVKVMKTYPKRLNYAIRAMTQTRAISRAGRSAFAHVVVMMNAGLSTTPAEEVPDGGFADFTPAGPDQGAVDGPRSNRAAATGGVDPRTATVERIKAAIAAAATSDALASIGRDEEAAYYNMNDAQQADLDAAFKAKGAALKAGGAPTHSSPPKSTPQASAVLDDEIPF